MTGAAQEELARKIRVVYDAAGCPSLRTIARAAHAAPMTVSSVVAGKVSTWAKTADILMALGVESPRAEFHDTWRRAAAEYALSLTDDSGDIPAPTVRGLAVRDGVPPWAQLTADVADIKAMIRKLVTPVDHPFELELEAMILDAIQRQDLDDVDRQEVVAELVQALVEVFRHKVVQ